MIAHIYGTKQGCCIRLNTLPALNIYWPPTLVFKGAYDTRETLIGCKLEAEREHILAPEASTQASRWLITLSELVWCCCQISAAYSAVTQVCVCMCVFVYAHVSNRTEFRPTMECWQSAAWIWQTSACTSAWQRTSTAESSPTLNYES